MDAVEAWLREKAHSAPDDDPGMNPEFLRYATLVLETLADEWHERPPVALVPYQAETPLADFLEHVEGPAMIGLDPVIYPACTRCNHAWKLCRDKGVWAWYPDCAHKATSCKLVKA